MNLLRFKNPSLDRIDVALIRALDEDARITTAALARQVGLSAPSTSERLKRLEEMGVIGPARIEVDPAALGYGLKAWLRIRPLPGQLKRVVEIIQGIPEIVECDRVTGDDCFVARAYVRSVLDLEEVIDQLNSHATTNTAIIQSSPVDRRLPPLPGEA